jgi:predicted TIM-barrel fold metal-dependent hydrolase
LIALMIPPFAKATDCDVHVGVPSTSDLLPFLDEYWRDQIVARHIHKAGGFHLQSYPPNSPLSFRPDWRGANGLGGGDYEFVRERLLEKFGCKRVILNVLHGAISLFNEDLSSALVSAVNDWVAKEWLDRDPRLRASILLPMHTPANAVREIERLAHDRRFVQVLVPVSGDLPLGKRVHWPIFEAAQRHGLPIGVHAGSLYRHAPTAAGFPSFQIEDYVNQSGAFENMLVSLIAEGVFVEYPKLKVVCVESGCTWLPTLLWHMDKTWRGARQEVPWLDRHPSEYVREHVRFTLQPLDAPKDSQKLARTLAHMEADDLLLFSTDYPHWHFDGEAALPDGLPDALVRKMMIDNPIATYPRLQEEAAP